MKPIRGVAIVVLTVLPACGDIGLSPFAKGPLPAGGLPPSQTLEGGGQVRITSQGFAKINGAATSALTASLTGATICLPDGTASTLEYCYTNSGGCMPGCELHITPKSVQLSVTNQQTLNVKVVAAATSQVPVRTTVLVNSSCVATLGTNDLTADADIAFTIDPTTGELKMSVAHVNNVSAGAVTSTGCGVISDLSAVIASFVDSAAGRFVGNLLTPALDGVVQGYVTGGFAQRIDVGALLVGNATNGSLMETRVVAGGYAALAGQGLSYGVITGLNSDADIATRTPALASEPAACVAGLSPFDLTALPWSLPTTSRKTLSLGPASSFLGQPDPAADVIVGISEPSLDLAGHHAVASGALCLTLDGDRIASVRRDMLDDLLGVPLGDADAKMRVVLHPKKAMTFSVGEGTALSPPLTATLPGLVMDLEVESGGVFAPAVRLTTDVSQSYTFHLRNGSGSLEIEPISVGIAAGSSSVELLDSRYVGVSSIDARALLATLVDLVFGAVGPGDARFKPPRVAGFVTQGLTVTRVQTSQANFLTLASSLGASSTLGTAAPDPVPAATAVTNSDTASVQAALRGSGSGLPSVRIELPSDPTLEHSFRIGQGAWRPYAAGDIVIEDRSFAWQGPRPVDLRSRVIGDDTTNSPTTTVVLVIDYAPPTIFVNEISVDGTIVTVPARDAVSAPSALSRAIGAIGGPVPSTGFIVSESVELGALAANTDVMVYVKDEAGHVASAKVHLHDAPEAGANSGGGPSSGGGGSSAGGGAGGSAATGGEPSRSIDGGTTGALSDAGLMDASGGTKATAANDGSCGCRTAVNGSSRGAPWALALGLVLGSLARRWSRRRTT